MNPSMMNKYTPTVLWLLLCLFFIIIKSGCGKPISSVDALPIGKKSYPLLDNKAIMHEYRDNFDKMIFPKHNKKLTQYCSLHRHWEDIRAVWSKNGGDDFRWQYYVMKNKKSFK